MTDAQREKHTHVVAFFSLYKQKLREVVAGNADFVGIVPELTPSAPPQWEMEQVVFADSSFSSWQQ